MTLPPSSSAMTTDTACDLLVIGSGAGALATAVTAAHLGLKVIVVEKDPQYGGTTVPYVAIVCHPTSRGFHGCKT